MAKNFEPREFKNKAIQNFDEAFEVVNKIAKHENVRRFKIGKTSLDLNTTFNSRYSKYYDKILPVRKSKFGPLMDLLEIELIATFIDTAKNDNDQLGGGPALSGSDLYQIYTVVKLNKK